MKKAIRIISLLLIMCMLFSMPLSAANVEKQDISEEERTIIFAEVNEKQNKIVKVPAEDISDCENGKFLYEDANGSEKTIKIDKTADVIYNGKRITDYIDETFEIEAGYITFINNNNDSIYDVIDIIEYKNYAVKIFDASNKKIYDKYNALNSLTLDDGEETLIVEDLDSNKMSYTFITKNNVLINGYDWYTFESKGRVVAVCLLDGIGAEDDVCGKEGIRVMRDNGFTNISKILYSGEGKFLCNVYMESVWVIVTLES